MRHVTQLATAALTALAMLLPLGATAQDGPLRIEITEGVIEPLPVAVPIMYALNSLSLDAPEI